jgi:cytochrome c biogenesis protein CcdA/DsbC/DsbD-like thiol-disulfide interchange protein
MRPMNLLRTPIAVSILVLLSALAAPPGASAQDLLFPGSKRAAARHVTWKVSVAPGELRPGGTGEIVAGYKLAKGWHLYAPDHEGVQKTVIGIRSHRAELAGKPKFPAPKVERIEILDETQRLLVGEGEIRQPFRLSPETPPGRLELEVEIRFMTCTETTCDPPAVEVQKVSVDVAPGPPATAAGGEAESPFELRLDRKVEADEEDGADAEPPRVVWKLSVRPEEVRRGERAEVVAAYELEEGWHLYAPDFEGTGVPTELQLQSPWIELQGGPAFPKPKDVRIEELDEVQRLLEGKGEIRQAFTVKPEAAPGKLELEALLSYMTCTASTCDLPVTGEPHRLELTVSALEPVKSARAPSQGLLAFILLMVGGGLIALVMPCTYPMIPITISFFTKQADERSGAVLPLALAYGAGIILVFNVIGWVVGPAIITFASSWQLNLAVAVLFIVFALSLFGLFNLRLPSFLNNLAGQAGSVSGYAGVFLLGTTLVITSFTCTGPVMAPLLVLAGREGSFGHLTLGMTAFGATMAAPFVLLSLFPGRARKLPRSGEWMNTVKVFFGFIELAAALKFLSNAEGVNRLDWLPRELYLALWAAIFAIAGLYLLGVIRMRDEEARGIGGGRLIAGLGCILLAFYFHLGTLGYRLDRLTETLAPPYSSERRFPAGGGAVQSKWTIIHDDIDKGLAAARKEGKRALINFTGFT